jgi:Ser/Thr protein kinase RdoA (MazF antagonist)
VAAPIAAKTGETIVVLDGGYYELYPFCPGEVFRWEREDELRSAARALGCCHKALADFPQPAAPLRRKDSPEAILEGLQEIQSLTCDQRILDEIVYLAEQAERIATALPDDKYFALPCQMIHGDYHPANVVFRGGEVVGIFDWDCAAWLPKVRDVADGLIYFAARREGGFDATDIMTLTKCCWPDKRRFDIFLREYSSEAPLTDAESASLQWFIRARWIFSRIEGRLKIPKETWPAYLIDGIRPVLAWCDENLE